MMTDVQISDDEEEDTGVPHKVGSRPHLRHVQNRSLDEGLKVADANPTSLRRSSTRRSKDERSMSSRSSESSSAGKSLDALMDQMAPHNSRGGDRSVVSEVVESRSSSRRGGLGGHHSSRSIGSSGSSDRDLLKEATSSSRELRRKERVRSARERLAEEESKVKRLQEEAKFLEEQRRMEEARLEALRKEAQDLERPSSTSNESVKPLTRKVSKKYGAAAGDTSQLPPAFQNMYASKNKSK